MQASLLLAAVLAFFLLTSRGAEARLGLYGAYLRRFAGVYAAAAVAAAALAAGGGYRLAHAARAAAAPGGASAAAATAATAGVTAAAAAPPLGEAGRGAFDAPGYLPIWVVQRAALLAFECAAARGAALSLRPPGGAWAAAAAAAGLGEL